MDLVTRIRRIKEDNSMWKVMEGGWLPGIRYVHLACEPPLSFLSRSEPTWLFWLLQLGEIAVYGLDTESAEAGEGEVGGETRQTMPTLLYDAHGGRLTDPLSSCFRY